MLCLTLSLAKPALATNYHQEASPGGFDFALDISNHHLDLDYAQITHDAELERLGISVFDTQDPRLEYGFLLGSSRLSVGDDANLAGINLDGYYAGLALHSHMGRNPQALLRVQYLYQEVSNLGGSQTAIMSWHEWQAGGAINLLLGNTLLLSAGLEQKGIDARQHLRGDVSLTQPIDKAEGFLTTVGASLLVENGRIELSVQRGITRGFRLSFARGF